MRAKCGLGKREVERLIKPLFSDLIRLVYRETPVLDERSRMLSDLSRELRGGREKTESKVDHQVLKEWVKPAIVCIDRIAREKTQEIKDEFAKEVVRAKIVEQLRLSLCSKLLFTCGETTVRKLTIALGAAAGAVALAWAIAKVLENGDKIGEEALRKIREREDT